MATIKRGQVLRRPKRIELRAYAGKNPATGKPHYLSEYLPLATPEKEIGRRLTALVGRADDLAARRRARRAGAEPAATPNRARTTGDALEAWWREQGRHLASASTARTHLDSYLLPKLGPVELWRLRGSVGPAEAAADPDLFDLSVLFDELLAGGSVGTPGRAGGRPLAPSTVTKTKGYLSAALTLELARPDTPLAANPCAGVRLPRIEERESTTPEPDEMAAFLPYLAGERIRPAHTVTRRRADGTPYTFVMPERVDRAAADRVGRQLLAFALLVASGPRPQEVAALQRGHLDRASGRLSLTGEGIVDGKHRRGETEKRRRRVITLDDRTLAAVEDLLRAQDETALACGIRLGWRAYLFSRSADCSTPIDPDGPGQAFERTVAGARRAGISVPAGMRLYDMRHYGITQLLRAGRDVAAVARRFGTSPQMIHQRYQHAIPGDDDRLADTLGSVFGDPPAAPATVVPIRR